MPAIFALNTDEAWMIEDPTDARFGRRGRAQRDPHIQKWPPVPGFHDIVVHVEDTERGAARLAIAKNIALAHAAALHGVGIPEADDRPVNPSILSETGAGLFPLSALVDFPATLAPDVDANRRQEFGRRDARRWSNGSEPICS